MMRYNPIEIEKKWQESWEKDGIYEADLTDVSKPKYYGFSMLPGITGSGIHIGHGRTFQFSDIKVRAKRQQGYNAYNPIGWDSFGLPVENYAIKVGKTPREAHDEALVNFKRQLKRLGYSYDWSKEISTADPQYYRWTQWIFKKLFEHGLAYQKQSMQWWCETDQTVLANEQVEAGRCWRCHNLVTKKNLKQWFFKITDYADEILEATDDLNWTESVKTMQKNWIGRSVGAEVDFAIDRQSNFVLLHGHNGSPDKGFFPFVREALEKNGAKVKVIDLTEMVDKDLGEQANHVIKHASFDENTVLLGHSLGAAVGLKVLEKLDSPIRKLVSVTGFDRPGFLDKERDFENTINWQFDYTKIKNNVCQVVILRDLTDDVLPAERAEQLQASIGGQIIDFEAEESHAYGKVEPAVLEALRDKITVFTTRPDTLFGASFVVLAPEHDLAKSLLVDETMQAVLAYIDSAIKKSEVERMNETREKTGVFTGSYAINPVNGNKVPIWVADYVLSGYGTGAVMAVPAHDERDFAFAEKFELPIIQVIEKPENSIDVEPYHGEGALINSGQFDGIQSSDAREQIVAWLEQQGLGKQKTSYKMRDWLISRQRYWGAPIPIVHCPNDGPVALPDNQLPLILPEVEDFKPHGGAVSALASETDWVNTFCPKCGGPALRETDTMDGYACSSWYFLRYLDPFNDKQAWDPNVEAHWGPVDFYNGADHAVAHLLYARFWMRFFYRLGLVSHPEPFKRMMYNAYIMAPDGTKMSKSRGNVIDPMEIMDSGYGADALRVYEMFIAPYDIDAPWDKRGVPGTYRFLNRVWNLTNWYIESESGDTDKVLADKILRVAHQTVKKVTSDIEDEKFNTAVSSMMEAVNNFYKLMDEGGMHKNDAWKFAIESLLMVLAPFAPHITEELWHLLGHHKTIHIDNWPMWDDKYLSSDKMTIVVQVNGKVRAKIEVDSDASEQAIVENAYSQENVKAFIGVSPAKKTVYVPGRLLNIVV